MISKQVYKVLNDQMNFEDESARLYRALGIHAEVMELNGFGCFFNKRADEEMDHYGWIRDYIDEQGEHPILNSLPKPPSSWDNPLKMLMDSLAHEKKVTSNLKNIMNLAKAENDYQTEELMYRMLKEQVEEEDMYNKLIARYLMFADGDMAGLQEFDESIGEI